MKKIFAVILTVSVLLCSVPATSLAYEEKEPSGTEIALDIILIRPLGVASVAAGAAFFVVGLPFTLPTMSVGLAARKLVVEPFKYTFVRPIGDMDKSAAY
ncbi:MAG: hypothetical protein HZB84_00450 [Deltaproteobacteria bacterium]|nr:hypothetical protein [Deltaproteobacteria bacterium]